jgi:hypothetical protein
MSASEIPPVVLIVMFVFLPLGAVGFAAHQHLYARLYESLLERRLVDRTYAPRLKQRMRAGGCMRLLARIEAEVPGERMTDSDRSLVRSIRIAYNLGVPGAVAFVAMVFYLVLREV